MGRIRLAAEFGSICQAGRHAPAATVDHDHRTALVGPVVPQPQLLEAIASGQSFAPYCPRRGRRVARPVHRSGACPADRAGRHHQRRDTALFAGAARYLLRRRSFTGDDAVPASRRRATVRIGIAVAAISALLGVFSGVRPTTLISTYWIRPTALTWIERNYGHAIARAYAGHTTPHNPTDAYTRATVTELAGALSALTNEPHPLACTDPGGAAARSRRF